VALFHLVGGAKYVNPILAYFDLNNREATTPLSPVLAGQREQTVVGENSLPEVIQPVPFGVRKRRRTRQAGRTTRTLALWEQALFYLGTVIGVLFSSSVIQFQSGKAVTFNITVVTVTLSAIVGLILMPFIDKKGIKPDSPFVVQLGLFVQAGVFWSVVFTLIGKAYG
jgi:hypothetical protein